MARWLVTQGDRQFAAKDLNELKQLAAQGKVGLGDMIQPPGASDWLYASELPELKGLMRGAKARATDDELDMPRKGVPTGLVVAMFLGIAVVGGGLMWYLATRIQAADLDLFGKDGLALTEMLVTDPAGTIHTDPTDGSRAVANVPKDSKVQLLAKRGAWYQVRSPAGAEGWMAVNDVVPAYFFADEETRSDYDPVYNPDRYVFVKNSSWMLLPTDPFHPELGGNVTVFSFMLQNKSKFEMTDLLLMATIKDKNDRTLETKEIALEGGVPPYENTSVGTLKPPDDSDGSIPSRLMTEDAMKKEAKTDEELYLRWTDGIEVQMASEGFVEANIDLLQIRAVARKL